MPETEPGAGSGDAVTGPQDPEQEQPEEGTAVYVLHMPGGKTYIGQPRPIEPEPEAGQ